MPGDGIGIDRTARGPVGWWSCRATPASALVSARARSTAGEVDSPAAVEEKDGENAGPGPSRYRTAVRRQRGGCGVSTRAGRWIVRRRYDIRRPDARRPAPTPNSRSRIHLLCRARGPRALRRPLPGLDAVRCGNDSHDGSPKAPAANEYSANRGGGKGKNGVAQGLSNCSRRPSRRSRSHSASPAGSFCCTRKNQENRAHSCGSSLRIPGCDIR
jgi:hypothetical protein